MGRQRLAFFLTITGAVLFNNWILGLLFNVHLIWAGGSVSELSAVTQPHNLVFRLLDVASGLMLATGLGLYLSLGSLKRWQVWIARSGLILGLANCVDALLPLPCSGTIDKACNWPVRIDWQRISLPDHAFSSGIIGLLFFLIPILVLTRASNLRDKKLSVLSWLSLISLVVFVFTLSVNNHFIDRVSGFTQEIQIFIFSWLIMEVAKSFSREVS